MILALVSSFSLATAPALAVEPRPAQVHFAGLIRKKKSRWVELPQEVQVEGDYSPTVGRQPEPENQPFGRVRYISPEERAQPIIVPPKPKLVYIDEPAEEAKSSGGTTEGGIGSGGTVAPTISLPGYVTSLPSAIPTPDGMSPAGSATGSTAYPDYTTPKQ